MESRAHTALARCGGGAKVELPAFAMKLDAARERSPLEVLYDDVARGLGEPPETTTLEPVLGDLTFSGDGPAQGRVEAFQASDAEGQARVVADAVHRELARGTAVEEMAVLVPSFEDAVVEPIVRALEDLGLRVHDPRGTMASASACDATVPLSVTTPWEVRASRRSGPSFGSVRSAIFTRVAIVASSFVP